MSKYLLQQTLKQKKPHVKSADWTEDETNKLLQAWAPRFSRLQRASQREERPENTKADKETAAESR